MTNNKQLISVAKRVLISTVLVAAALWTSVKLGLDLNTLKNSFQKIDISTVLVLASLVCIQVSIQGLRLRTLLPKEYPVGLAQIIHIQVIGQAINCILPARAGDFYKAVSLKNSMQVVGYSYGHSLGTVFVADKVADFMAMILVAMFYLYGSSLNTHPETSIPLMRDNYLPWAVFFLISGSVIFTYRNSLMERFPALRNMLSSAFKEVRFYQYGLGILLTFISVAIECTSLQVVTGALGYEINWIQGLATYLILNLGIAVPITVANIGAYEASIAGGLSLAKIPLHDGLAAGVIHHLIQLGGVILPSLLIISISTFKKRKSIGIRSS